MEMQPSLLLGLGPADRQTDYSFLPCKLDTEVKIIQDNSIFCCNCVRDDIGMKNVIKFLLLNK